MTKHSSITLYPPSISLPEYWPSLRLAMREPHMTLLLSQPKSSQRHGPVTFKVQAGLLLLMIAIFSSPTLLTRTCVIHCYWTEDERPGLVPDLKHSEDDLLHAVHSTHPERTKTSIGVKILAALAASDSYRHLLSSLQWSTPCASSAQRSQPALDFRAILHLNFPRCPSEYWIDTKRKRADKLDCARDKRFF